MIFLIYKPVQICIKQISFSVPLETFFKAPIVVQCVLSPLLLKWSPSDQLFRLFYGIGANLLHIHTCNYVSDSVKIRET